jgi:hypothetical protein
MLSTPTCPLHFLTRIVCIVIGYRLDCQDLIPNWGKIFFFTVQHIDLLWGSASLLIQWVPVL